MIKTIEERIKEVRSSKDSHDFLINNITTAQSGVEKANSQYRALALQLFLLFFAFELLTRAAISEVSLGYFKIGDLTLVIKILPIIISYTYYELSATIFLRKLKTNMISAYIKNELQPIFKTDLDLIIFSSTPPDAEDIITRNIKGITATIIGNLTFPLLLVVWLGPLIFIMYSYYRIFTTYGFGDILSWIFFPVSLLFLIQGFSILLQYEKLAPPIT
jgi:hypothetical protein